MLQPQKQTVLSSILQIAQSHVVWLQGIVAEVKDDKDKHYTLLLLQRSMLLAVLYYPQFRGGREMGRLPEVADRSPEFGVEGGVLWPNFLASFLKMWTGLKNVFQVVCGYLSWIINAKFSCVCLRGWGSALETHVVRSHDLQNGGKHCLLPRPYRHFLSSWFYYFRKVWLVMRLRTKESKYPLL